MESFGNFRNRTFKMVIDGSLNIVEYAFIVNHPKQMKIRTSKDEKNHIQRVITMINFEPLLPAFYLQVCRFVLSYQMLIDHAFPLDSPKYPGIVAISEYFRKGWSDVVCKRCKKAYSMFNEHQLPSLPCHYHPGLKVKGKDYYSCCRYKQACCCDFLHVPPSYKMKRFVFEKTRPVILPCYSVYALDTEMCITKKGFEVTRVTVIDMACNIIYDSFVQPNNPIIDHNTKYSGVTAEDLLGITTTLRDVQAALLALVDANTILVGHGLENDLTALNIIHHMVVDTSILFPDQRGYPFKRSLKSIVAEYLHYDIQSSPKGHSSIEDALACMQLMKFVQWLPPTMKTVLVPLMPLIPQFMLPVITIPPPPPAAAGKRLKFI